MGSQTQFGMGVMKKNSILKAAWAAAFAALLCVGCGDKGVTPPAEYTLNIDWIPLEGGYVERKPNKTSYKTGENVTVTATADTGYRFVRWTGAETSKNSVITITINTNVALTANFEQDSNPPITPPSGNTFTDSRDGKEYRRITIGTQVWMGENLGYDVPGVETDVCYNNSADSCAKYGRLYNWNTALGGTKSSSTNPSGIQGVCPEEWHIPSDAEWTALVTYVGGLSTAGTKLKSSQYWISYSGVPAGTDEYEFSALPGGGGYSGGSFKYVNDLGHWWSATESSTTGKAWLRRMNYNSEKVDRFDDSKTYPLSVRCVQD
jgi:uncharacterized protein (TIGR02145 family)/uncharacterized repeat protein (TIGR02543 family)